MTWDLQFAATSVPLILRGLLVTLQITVLGSLVAYALGLVFALVRRARVPVVDQVLFLFIEFVRSTPLLVQIFVLYYVFPSASASACRRS